MYIRILFSLIFLSSSYFVLSQLPGPSEISKLKIKKITQQNANEKSAAGTSIWYYNANGHDTAYYSYGSRSYYKSYEYDGKQRVKTIKKYSDAGKNTENTSFVYNADGSFTSKNTDTQYGMTNTEESDKKGNVIKKIIPDGSVHQYEYNSKSQLVKAYAIPKAGGMEFTSLYTYNNIGKLVKIATTGEYPSTSTYVYDTKGLLKKSVITSEFDEEKTVTAYLYEYGY